MTTTVRRPHAWFADYHPPMHDAGGARAVDEDIHDASFLEETSSRV